MAAETMLESKSLKKGEESTIDLREKVTLYAPKSAEHHTEGEAIKIHPVLKEKFMSKGFTEKAPKDK